MIFAFKNYTLSHSKNIFWAFCTFYGLTFAVGFESTGSDINSYVSDLQNLYNQHNLTISQAIQAFKDSGEIDIFQSIISYILSRFTYSQAILTMIYGLIFGFFFSRNIWYVFNMLEGRLSVLTKFILLALVLVVPIWNINGMRMYLAFHVFIYGLLPYIFEDKKSILIFSFLSFLIHFSFFIPILILLIHFIVGNRLTIYFIIFIGSIFISEIDIGKLNQFVGRGTIIETLIERSAGYTDEQVVDEFRDSVIKSSKNWYSIWFNIALKWSLIIILIYLFFIAKREIKIIPAWKKIFSFSLLFFIISNLLSGLPSGARFYTFAFFLSLIMTALYINQFKNDHKFKFLIQVLSPAILLFIIISFRMGLYFTSISSVFGNPVIALFSAGQTIPLNDLIK